MSKRRVTCPSCQRCSTSIQYYFCNSAACITSRFMEASEPRAGFALFFHFSPVQPGTGVTDYSSRRSIKMRSDEWGKINSISVVVRKEAHAHATRGSTSWLSACKTGLALSWTEYSISISISLRQDFSGGCEMRYSECTGSLTLQSTTILLMWYIMRVGLAR